MLDSLVFTAEAEIRWLDHCEARLRRAAYDRDAAIERPVEARAPLVEPIEDEVPR